jgi:hypothetical protein
MVNLSPTLHPKDTDDKIPIIKFQIPRKFQDPKSSYDNKERDIYFRRYKCLFHLNIGAENWDFNIPWYLEFGS